MELSDAEEETTEATLHYDTKRKFLRVSLKFPSVEHIGTNLNLTVFEAVAGAGNGDGSSGGET